MVFVSMIQVRLEYISEKLRLIKWNNEFNSNLTLTFLRDMCVLHMKLNDITLLINEVFGISIMANVAMYFVQFVCGGYTMVFAFKSITDTTEMYQLCLTSIIYNYPYLPLFFWICYCCRCTIQESTKVGQRLHSLNTGEEIDSIQDQIKTFSLQVLHQNIEFSAGDFFTINFTLIFAIICAFTNYLIILMQFS
ncbi:putative gustatory receptor 2a [Atheta coriaria]|uniref:putative gustatory receptor 2a n=1 Tax=Dalotia coriaria TaxID=877792 RepID=UPI0031F387FC